MCTCLAEMAKIINHRDGGKKSRKFFFGCRSLLRKEYVRYASALADDNIFHTDVSSTTFFNLGEARKVVSRTRITIPSNRTTREQYRVSNLRCTFRLIYVYMYASYLLKIRRILVIFLSRARGARSRVETRRVRRLERP